MHNKFKQPLVIFGALLLSFITVLGVIITTFDNNDYRKSLTFLIDNFTSYHIEIVEPFSCEISTTPRFTMAKLKLFLPDTPNPLEFNNLKFGLNPAPLLRGRLQMTITGLIEEPKTLKYLLPRELLALKSVTLSTRLTVNRSMLKLKNLKINGSNPQGLTLQLTGFGLINDFSAPQPFSELNLAIQVKAPRSSMLQGYLPDTLPEIGPVRGSLRLVARPPAALAAQAIKLDFGKKDELYMQVRGEITNIPLDPEIINTGIDLEINIDAPAGTLLSDRDHAPSPSLQVPTTGALHASFKLAGDSDRIRLGDFSGRFGQTTITAEFAGSIATTPPQIKGKILIATLFPDDFRELLSKAAPPQTTRTPNQSSNQNKLPHKNKTDPVQMFSHQPLPRDWLHKINCDIQLKIDNIDGLQKNLKDLDVTIKIDDGKLKLDPASLIFEGGTTKTTLLIDDTGATPTIKLESNIAGLDLTELLTYFDATAPISGKLTAHTQLSSRGLSLHELMSNLDGNFGVNLEEGQIPNTALKLIAIDILGWSFSKALMQKKSSEINCCVLSLVAEQGTLEIRAFIFDSKNMTISGTGTINLATETCRLTLYPKKKKKFWATVSPVLIKGPLRDPQVLAVPLTETTLLYGGAFLAPQFFLPAIGINFLWEMVVKNGKPDKNPCLKFLYQQSRESPQPQ